MTKSIFLFLLFIISFFLRFYLIPQDLFFGPEQGVDFLEIKNIVVNHNLTLIGAKTDIQGVFHGPIYYYLAVLPFAISKGDPVIVLAFFILINSFTVFLIYFTGKKIFNDRVGIIAAVLYTFSYGIIVYSRWLSSHPLSIPLSCLFFLFFIIFLKGEKWGLIGTVISYALLGQSEFLNFIFFGAILIILFFLYKEKFLKQKILFLVLSLFVLIVLSIGNYILFDIRHNLLVTKSVLNLVSGGMGYYLSVFDTMRIGEHSFIDSTSQFVFPNSSIIFFITLLFCMATLFIYRKKFPESMSLLLLWLLTPLVILILLRHDIQNQFFVSCGPAAIFLFAFFIERVWEKNHRISVVLFLAVLFSNLFWYKNIPESMNIFFQSTQLLLKLSDEKKVIDEIYRMANKKNFSFQAYTIPYWSQEGWKYLFWQYGKQKYGYEPKFENTKTIFVIVQKDPNNQDFQKQWLNTTVVGWGKLQKTSRYGILTLMELTVP